MAGSSCLALASLGGARAVAAERFPARGVTIVVPAPAGALPDIFCRKIAERLAQRWGQPVTVENRPGGATAVGARHVADAPADGYTLLYAPFNTLVLNALMARSLPYDPVREFTPVTLAGRAPLVLVVSAGHPARSLDEFIAIGRQASAPAPYGSPGAASMPHLFAALFARLARMEAAHVPAANGAKALEDLLAGRVQYVFDAAVSVQSAVAQGQLRALAVTSPARIPEFPDTPTLVERGVAEGHWTLWGGFVAPAATPPERIAQLNAAIRAENERGGFVDDIPGTQRVGSTPEGFAELLAAERVRWRGLVDLAGVRLD